MKEIVNYIKEGLKINSKTKINQINKDLIDKITDGWFIKNPKSGLIDSIKNWIKQYNISDIDYATDQETLAEYKSKISSKEMLDIINKYDDSYDTNEKCQDKLDKTNILYSDTDFGFDIMGSKDLLAFVGPHGTLYCLPK